jgi:hypothetical protein
MRHEIVSKVLSLFGLMGCACGPGPVTPVAQKPALLLSAAPALSAPAPSATESKPAPVLAQPTPEGPFHIVATGVALFPTQAGLLLHNGGDLLAEIDGDTITAHPEYLGTYVPEMMSNLEVVGGQWPKHGLISVSRPEARSSYSTLYEKNGKGWRQLARTAPAEWYAGVQSWSNGRTLALVLSMGYGYRWDVVAGPRGIVPKPSILPPVPNERDFSMPRVRAVAFSALPSGELFALGSDDSPDATRWTFAVERWASGTPRGVIDVLPKAAENPLIAEPTGIFAVGASDVYVYGALHEPRDLTSFKVEPVGAYLVHFDGKGWILVPLPSKGAITSLAVGDNALWVVSGGSLYKQALGKTTWETVPLPSEEQVRATVIGAMPYLNGKSARLQIEQVYVDRQHVVWLDGYAGQQTAKVVLRNRPIPAVWNAPSDSNWTHSVQQFQPYRAADEWCQNRGQPIFVMLYAATKSTPKDYDYPLTRAALKGHAEFQDVVFAETEELGRHYFGAFLEDLALARKLVVLVEKGVKGSKPVALCRDPKKVRVLGIDLKTGNVISNKPTQADAN